MDSPGRTCSSVTWHITVDSYSKIPVYPCEIIWKCMADSAFASLRLDSLPSVMKAIFFPFPTLTAGVCSSPATLQLRPALCIYLRHWESLFQWLLLLWIYVRRCAALYIQYKWVLSLPINPVMLQCTGSLGYIKPNFFRDEKLNMIVQMSSCPLRGIVMYIHIVVGFNCDIYEMWESNVCAPFRLC